MSIRFQAANDLNRAIVDATLLSEPRIDFQAAQAANLDGLSDQAVLHSAASQSRIPQNALIREVIETLILIWADDQAEDWKNLVGKIPF